MELTTTNRNYEVQNPSLGKPWECELSKFAPTTLQSILRFDIATIVWRPSPTLASLRKKYGIIAPIEWLSGVVKYVTTIMGVEINEFLTLATANGIYSNCYGWHVSEILCFFAHFVAGKYGKFYGRFDNAIIYDGMQKFWKYEILPIREQSEREQKEKERAAWSNEAITPQEFCKRNNLPDNLSVAGVAEYTSKVFNFIDWLNKVIKIAYHFSKSKKP